MGQRQDKISFEILRVEIAVVKAPLPDVTGASNRVWPDPLVLRGTVRGVVPVLGGEDTTVMCERRPEPPRWPLLS